MLHEHEDRVGWEELDPRQSGGGLPEPETDREIVCPRPFRLDEAFWDVFEPDDGLEPEPEYGDFSSVSYELGEI